MELIRYTDGADTPDVAGHYVAIVAANDSNGGVAILFDGAAFRVARIDRVDGTWRAAAWLGSPQRVAADCWDRYHRAADALDRKAAGR